MSIMSAIVRRERVTSPPFAMRVVGFADPVRAARAATRPAPTHYRPLR